MMTMNSQTPMRITTIVAADEAWLAAMHMAHRPRQIERKSGTLAT
jgi:hypothetical protein